jgi:hypothetical protein
MPAKHVLHGVQAAAFWVVLNCPVAHAAHTRSTVAEGVLATCWPASQVAQAAQARAFAVVVKVPSAQGAHTRSLVGVPSAAIKVPGGQTLMAAQAVAGLPSWSQVPPEQVVAGLVPPAQN